MLIHPSVEMWSVSMFDLDFVRDRGGMKQVNNYYGGVEIAMLQDFKKFKKCLAYLTEYKERYFVYPPETTDQEYQEYKQAHLQGFTGSMEEWLKLAH